jgi:hypothetical protein
MDPEEHKRQNGQIIRLREVMKLVACLPEEQWLEAAIDVLRNSPELGIPVTDADTLVDFFSMNMRIQHVRLGRAVQPLGRLHVLAPIIGAIRLNARGGTIALNFLVNRMMAAIHAADGKTLRVIAKFTEEPLGTHRNCLIWDAITELTRQKEVYKTVRIAGSQNWMQFPTYPNTKEVRAYVVQQQIQNRFTNLPVHDKDWTRLWKESGAKLLIREATRGKSAR